MLCLNLWNKYLFNCKFRSHNIYHNIYPWVGQVPHCMPPPGLTPSSHYSQTCTFGQSSNTCHRRSNYLIVIYSIEVILIGWTERSTLAELLATWTLVKSTMACKSWENSKIYRIMMPLNFKFWFKKMPNKFYSNNMKVGKLLESTAVGKEHRNNCPQKKSPLSLA